ncbi:MAG TPA: hypothetical protein VGB73_04740 [Pyrinomonadaceae bacterium]|jgi:hypothetical protein
MTVSLCSRRVFLCLALLVCSVSLSPVQAFSQEESAPATPRPAQAREEVDLEIHLQLLMASNGAGSSARLPPSLDATMKQLRASLPFENYRTGAAFLYRIKNGRPLDVRGTGNVMQTTTINNPYTPSFYHLSLHPVEIKSNASGKQMVSVNEFHFGLKVPITTSLASVSPGSQAQAAVQYQDTGISTGLSFREGEPVVVGTIYFGSADEAIIVILTAKRIS